MSDLADSTGDGPRLGADDAAEREPAARIEATVRGRVQGVGFRWFVSRAASRLELVGWVTNRRDGSVLLVAEGPEAALENLLAIVERGPAGASVDHMDVKRGPATGNLQGFAIRSGSHPGD
jgi:acylphosphatase